MINKSMAGAAAIVRIAQAGAKYPKYLGKLQSLVSAVLQRLYAAHMERAQMRFAPVPIYSGRFPKHRHFFHP